MTEEDALKFAMHQINASAKSLNKDIVQKSATMQNIPTRDDIYQQARPKAQPKRQASQNIPPPQVSHPVPQQVNTDPALLNSLIERVASVESQITKFVNLVQKQVARNAKEINIRIKLDNVPTNKE